MKQFERKIFLIIHGLIITSLIACVPPASLRNLTGNMHGNSRKAIVHTAKRYIGVKYKRGGTNPSGFDCSGYVYYVYKKNGYNIPRTSKRQCKKGIRVSIRDAKPGDLIFFNTSGNTVSHVAIYIGENRFIHAPSTGKKVSFESINNPYWKKRYLCVVTYFRKKAQYRNNNIRRSFIPVSYE